MSFNSSEGFRSRQKKPFFNLRDEPTGQSRSSSHGGGCCDGRLSYRSTVRDDGHTSTGNKLQLEIGDANNRELYCSMNTYVYSYCIVPIAGLLGHGQHPLAGSQC